MKANRQSPNATGKALNLKSFMMRNKLKLSKKSSVKDAWCPFKDLATTADVKPTVLSESTLFYKQTDGALLSEKDTHGSNVAAAGKSDRKIKPLQEQRKSFCAKDIKIAPIFLHARQHSKCKRSSDGKQDQPAEELQKSVLPPQSVDVQEVESHRWLSSSISSVCHLSQRCRGQLSPSDLHSGLEVIQTSNPAFPVRGVFSTLQKKASLQDFGSSENSLNRSSVPKRKRGNESSERAPKRPRSSLITEGAVGMGQCHISAAQVVQKSPVLMVKRQPRSNKLSRSHRLRQRRENPAHQVNICELYSGLKNHTESDDQSLRPSDGLQTDLSFEDVIWTDKYSPHHSREVIGNSASVNKLHSWLKKWKLRADCDERRKTEEQNQTENSSNSWDCGDFQGEAGAEDNRKEPLCNAMLITGPPGVGKTAAVYACAQELGFKVFEVNCSSQRSGYHVLSQLKEATQSHLVEISGKDPLKPTFFNNYSIKSSTPKSETLPGKNVPPKNVTSTSKKRAALNFGRSSRKRKVNPATVTLANYFKMKAKADHLHFSGLSPSDKPDSKTSVSPSSSSDEAVPQNKRTATSLILFEEVDVIFDDDVGFLAAIKTFMTTTKRPVILTTNDPLFRERFNCSLEEIIFRTPPAVNVCSYLQLVGLTENMRLELDDVSSLLSLCRGDVRRCLLQLQFWVQSGGRRAPRSEGLPKELTDSNVTERGDNKDCRLTQRDTGCTASMLGLPPVTQSQLLNLLKCQFWSETYMMKLLRLLAESWRRGVPLLYSNLKLLLPIRAGGTSVHFPDKGACSGLQSELATPDLLIQQLNDNISPEVSATNNKSVRHMSRLSRGKYITTTFDTTSSSSLTQTPPRTSLSSMRAHSRTSSSRDKPEQNASKVANRCLDALTNLFDLMSYLDATMPAAAPLVSGSCRPGAFVWTGAEIRDGLLDEVREEEGRGWSQERVLDIQAAVEALGCRRCLWQVSEAWTDAQQYTQDVGHARWERQNLSFTFQPLCAPSVSQRRYELSRTVLGNNYFTLLGNRRAVSVDYMPALRYICRFQKAQRQTDEPVRNPNYLSSVHLGLSKSTIQLLAEDFS